MKGRVALFIAVTALSVAGCRADLVVKDAQIDFDAKVARVIVANVGCADAGDHLTYIEINQVDSPDSAKPEAQHIAKVAGIAKGSDWESGDIPFSSFSTRSGIALDSLTTANLVVRADAKDMVKESDEDNNLYDANH